MIKNKKEMKELGIDNNRIVLDKKEVDKVLKHKDFNKFQQIFQHLPLASVLNAVEERNRLLQLIKKHDLNFIENIFSFFDKSSHDEIYKYKDIADFTIMKSNNKEFIFEIKFESMKHNHKSNNIKNSVRNDNIFSFKRKVMEKILHYKENADCKFIDQSLLILENHGLMSTFVTRKLADLVLKSNFEITHNHIIKNDVFKNKDFRKEYLGYVFQATKNIDHLNLLMKDFETDIREIFLEKKDNNDFWFDFKLNPYNRGDGIPPCYSVRPWKEVTDKLIWLEKHHLGFSNVETPYFIEFFKHLNIEETEKLLKDLDREKYINMFNQAVRKYDLMSINPQDEQTTKLLHDMKHKNWDNKYNFYEQIKVGMPKRELEQSMEVNQQPSKKTIKL
jgi:hypothetical protein